MAAPTKKPKPADDQQPNPEEQIPRRLVVDASAPKPETTKNAPNKQDTPPAHRTPATKTARKDESAKNLPLANEGPTLRNIFAGPLAEWIVSGVFFLGGLFALFTYPNSGAILIVMGLVVLPPINRFVLKRWKIKVSWKWKGAALAFLACLFVLVQLRRNQAEAVSRELASHPIVGKDTLKTGFRKDLLTVAAATGQNLDDSTTTRQRKIAVIGEKAVVGYFEISLDKARVDTVLGVANVYAEQLPGKGNTFVILDVTFKCIDKESQIPKIGNLVMKVGDRTYEFDKTETVTAPGWGLYFDVLNPLTTKTTKIVYKIPRDTKGEVFWRPGGNLDSLSFFCGRI